MWYKFVPSMILTEVVLTSTGAGKGMCIIIDDESDRVGEWYFKVFDHRNRAKASRCARIKFNRPEYVWHKRDAYDDFLLDDNDIISLISLLKQPFFSKEPQFSYLMHRQMKNWKAGTYIFNLYHKLSILDTAKMRYDSPNYNPRYIPVNLNMPNYWKLPRLTERPK